MPTTEPTRDRIVRTAMALFADRGFAATSITALEDAAGLAVGGGGVYKHFPSKQAILEEGIRRYEHDQEQLLASDFRLDHASLREALEGAVRLGLAMLESQRELIKVLFREMEPFPEVLSRLRERYIQATYAYFAAWLEALAERGDARTVDATGAAVVLVGAMVNYKVVEIFLGDPPGPMPEESFVMAWTDIAERYLQADVQ